MSYTYKPVEELTLTDDFMFGYIMKQEEYCKPILELLLGFKIRKLEYTELQKSIAPFYESKGVRLDVYVKDSGKVYDIEIQTSSRDDLSKRSRFYQSAIDMDNLAKGEDYETLPESFVLFICTFDPFGKGLPKYTFENLCVEDKAMELGDMTHKVFYNINAYREIKDPDSRALVQYLKTKQPTTDFTRNLDDGVERTKIINSFKESYLLFNMHDRDTLKRGREEGIKEANERNALNMLDHSLSLAVISECTGLSLEEIRGIAEKNGIQIKDGL